jgi:hypothetical protein
VAVFEDSKEMVAGPDRGILATFWYDSGFGAGFGDRTVYIRALLIALAARL